MKTLLLWGVDDTLSRHLTYQLSIDGHRLLVTGADLDKLQELDAALCQSEVHRFATTLPPRAVSEWVSEQHLGLDGAVLFVPPPEPGPALLAPITANLRRVERSVFVVIELLRELVPQLRRGKRPKRVLVVLPWDTDVGTVHTTPLVNLWRTLIGQLAEELSQEGVHINVLLTSPAPSDAVNVPPTSGPIPDEDTEGAGRTTIVPCDNAVFAAGWFSPALSPLSGQFLHHPNSPKTRSASQKSP